MRFLFITSNAGSLFGEKAVPIRQFWISQVFKKIESLNVKFVAIHIQESGGKNFKLHSREMLNLLDELSKRLCSEHKFTSFRCFLDINFELIEEYTALSSLFLIHSSLIKDIQQYDFGLKSFVKINPGKLVVTENLLGCGLIQKEKFSQDLWPSVRWGRKGFLLTRWKVGTKIFNLVNIHLFHDDSNLAFLEDPHQYSNVRKDALNYVLQRLELITMGNGEVGDSNLLFLFGDFNFRLNLQTFVNRLTGKATGRERGLRAGSITDDGETADEESCGEQSQSTPSDAFCEGSSSESDEMRNSSTSCDELLDDGEVRRRSSVVEYFGHGVGRKSDGYILRIGKKRFDFHEMGKLLESWSLYRDDDVETQAFPLYEKPIQFAPTYPWNEDTHRHYTLMNTRAPAWCDRVLMNANAWNGLVSKDPQSIYSSFGMEACIGDHKPVMLSFDMPSTN